jgi:hypothetical protein
MGHTPGLILKQNRLLLVAILETKCQYHIDIVFLPLQIYATDSSATIFLLQYQPIEEHLLLCFVNFFRIEEIE